MDGKVTLYTVGPLRLIDAAGREYAPRGQKAQGILAILARSPHHRRARTLLQDKLWSDRGPEQGAGSLRQALSEIRRALGPWRDGLLCDRTMVALDPSKIAVAGLAGVPDMVGMTRLDNLELFEGLDVSDPEFEDWLRDQRMQFESELEDLRQKGLVDDRSLSADVPPSPRHQPSYVLLSSGPVLGNGPDASSARALTDMVAKIVTETGSVAVLDGRDQADIDKRMVASADADMPAILAEVTSDTAQTTWRLVVRETIARRVIWSSVGRQRGGAPFDIGDAEVLRGLNQGADAALMALLSRSEPANEQVQATWLCREAIRHLARLGKDNLATADTLFEQAFALSPRGIFLAWRAYLRTYLIAERLCACRQTAGEEALAFIRQAQELEPNNSYVAGFAAQVHTIVQRSYVAAYEFAQRSIELNRANPLGWAFLGVAESHLGRTRSGLKRTLIARRIAGSATLRFQIDALSCIAAVMAGDIETAIHCGESSHALAPTFAPPLRYLSALYLLRGQPAQSEAKMRTLQTLEPDFSYAMLWEESYPAAGLHRSNLRQSLPERSI